MLQDGGLRGIDDYLLVSSGVLRGDEPILEASTEMAGELAPDRQSGHGINAGTGVRCQVARFGGRPSDLPYALLGRRAQRRYAVLPAGAPSPMPAPRILGNTGPMGDDSGRRGRAIRLTDRLGERGVLDQLIDAVRAGGSGVLVVRGEPGVGKSVLLDYLAGRASGCRVAGDGCEWSHVAGFAVCSLLAPVLDRVGRCRGRSGRRCGPRSASARARCRTGSWSGWRCWGWCPRWPPSGRWCAWSMTCSG